MQIGEDISWTVHTNWPDEKLFQIEKLEIRKIENEERMAINITNANET